MEAAIILAYCVSDDIVKKFGIKEQGHAKMTVAEVMTTALTASMYFGGNLENARKFMISGKYISKMLSKSQLNRRLHDIPEELWTQILDTLKSFFPHNENKFAIDSFPVSVCHNVRAYRNKIYTGKKFWGLSASKQEFFYGVRVHMITNKSGQPLHFEIQPANMHDNKAFKLMRYKFPPYSVVWADSAYWDYSHEAQLWTQKKVLLLAQRRTNTKQPLTSCVEKIRKKSRRIIETSFSKIVKLMPKSIHAITNAGFKLKIISFILAMAILNVC